MGAILKSLISNEYTINNFAKKIVEPDSQLFTLTLDVNSLLLTTYFKDY